MIFLEARHIKKSFIGVRALNDANFALKSGEVCGLVGANGSGKTTFARIVSGLLVPDGGELFLFGKQVNLRGHHDAERNRMAMVHQNLSLVPEMTIWENIALGREHLNPRGYLDNRKAIEEAEVMVRRLALDIPVQERVKNMAPDEKQLVEIAKALAKDPQILILDEPTASLDFSQVKSLFSTVRELRDRGVAIVFISHRIWEVAEICDRLIAFRNGETVGELDFSVQARDQRSIIPLITGQEAKVHTRKSSDERERALGESSRPLSLEVRDLSLSGGRLHNINFKLRPGEVLGLAGLQGQGQEDILMILAGYLHGHSGEVLVKGQPLALRNTRKAIKRGIVLIPGDRQKEGLFLGQSVKANLLFPTIVMHRGSLLLPMKRWKARIADAIHTVTLSPPSPHMIVSQLSGGNQQKIVVGKWLSLKPSVLLLNDPTKGVDVRTRENIYEIISALTMDGTSVVLYASDNEELVNNCDRILVIFEGKIVKELSGDLISEHNLIVSSLNIKDADAELQI